MGTASSDSTQQHQVGKLAGTPLGTLLETLGTVGAIDLGWLKTPPVIKSLGVPTVSSSVPRSVPRSAAKNLPLLVSDPSQVSPGWPRRWTPQDTVYIRWPRPGVHTMAAKMARTGRRGAKMATKVVVVREFSRRPPKWAASRRMTTTTSNMLCTQKNDHQDGLHDGRQDGLHDDHQDGFHGLNPSRYLTSDGPVLHPHRLLHAMLFQHHTRADHKKI